MYIVSKTLIPNQKFKSKAKLQKKNKLDGSYRWSAREKEIFIF